MSTNNRTGTAKPTIDAAPARAVREYRKASSECRVEIGGWILSSPFKLPRHSAKMRLLAPGAGTSAAAKKLRELLQSWNGIAFAEEAGRHIRCEMLAGLAWDLVVDQAMRDTFGRPYEATDYKIAGIARDEFPSEVKDLLRFLAQSKSSHGSAAFLFRYVAVNFNRYGRRPLDRGF